VFLARPLPAFGLIGAVLAVATVAATAMIYAQLRTVPRWHHWTTPAVFLTASAAGGLLLAGLGRPASAALALFGVALAAHWRAGDAAFAAAGQDAGTATGLGRIGRVRLLAPPHTGANYLLREMVHVVGRRRSRQLRLIALAAGVAAPAALALALPAAWPALALAAALHGAGVLAARWLFFAEAEHVVGLYYGHHAAGRA
jgi:DMSO reductase anchor subunit